MSKEEKKLKEFFARDLAGFEIAYCYFLERAHGLMGFFPAIIKENGHIVATPDQELLEDVRELLPKKKNKMGKILLLIKKDELIGYDISGKDDMLPLHLLTRDEFVERTEKEEEPFKWAPGLIGP